jgi:farnesyl-diphosphate farnesyltransferase
MKLTSFSEDRVVSKTPAPAVDSTRLHAPLAQGDDDFQSAMLQGVSRTFALTIPELPADLARVVSNAYLLCRIVDTIEDEPQISGTGKDFFCRQFLRTFDDAGAAATFARELGEALSDRTLPAEHELIRKVPRVVRITRSFSEPQREALRQCVGTMARGMTEFQLNGDKCMVKNIEDLDRYCYFVAGVVGQMLTRLFCLHSREIARHREALMPLAVSFGQGLQMTNILKDVWEDYDAGACWLPREVFAEEGCDLADLPAARNREGFERGVRRLIGISQAHLRNAVAYTLLIPRQETGIRKFCLWAIGLAVLTLRKINHHPDYTNGSQVKISRLSVKGTILATGLTLQNDGLLTLLFSIAARGLPPPPASTLQTPAAASDCRAGMY